MPVSLARFDQLIAESEQRVTEQAYRVMAMELDGKDATVARRRLQAFEGILAEFHYARRLVIESQRSKTSSAEPSHPSPRRSTE